DRVGLYDAAEFRHAGVDGQHAGGNRHRARVDGDFGGRRDRHAARFALHGVAVAVDDLHRAGTVLERPFLSAGRPGDALLLTVLVVERYLHAVARATHFL